MSKWRPVEKDAIYVIADIHGKYNQLKIILNRILPLRKSDGGKDKLIFLGDYVDRGIDSHKVLDELIKLKKKYKDQVIFIKGNHELMMLNGIKPGLSSEKYLFWMKNGGEATLSGYIKRNDFDQELDEIIFTNKRNYIQNPYMLPRPRVIDMIPKEHIEFLESCQSYYETDDYIFVHAGWDPGVSSKDQEEDMTLWDSDGGLLIGTVRGYAKRNLDLPWDKTIVVGHHWKGPFIYDKYMMLDVTGWGNVMVLEMNSREGFIAKPKNNRLVAFKEGKCCLTEPTIQ